jgi:hypothetical protein
LTHASSSPLVLSPGIRFPIVSLPSNNVSLRAGKDTDAPELFLFGHSRPEMARRILLAWSACCKLGLYLPPSLPRLAVFPCDLSSFRCASVIFFAVYIKRLSVSWLMHPHHHLISSQFCLGRRLALHPPRLLISTPLHCRFSCLSPGRISVFRETCVSAV